MAVHGGATTNTAAIRGTNHIPPASASGGSRGANSNTTHNFGEPMIGGGGFAFYQTRLATTHHVKSPTAGSGSYFANKPLYMSPASRQGKRYN